MSEPFLAKVQALHDNKELEPLVLGYLALSHVSKHLGYSGHGRYTKILREFCEEQGISLKHLTSNGLPVGQLLSKTCPQCGVIFSYKKSEEKETCSHSCANVYFAYKQGAKNRVTGNSVYSTDLERYYKARGFNARVLCVQ